MGWGAAKVGERGPLVIRMFPLIQGHVGLQLSKSWAYLPSLGGSLGTTLSTRRGGLPRGLAHRLLPRSVRPRVGSCKHPRTPDRLVHAVGGGPGKCSGPCLLPGPAAVGACAHGRAGPLTWSRCALRRQVRRWTGGWGNARSPVWRGSLRNRKMTKERLTIDFLCTEKHTGVQTEYLGAQGM